MEHDQGIHRKTADLSARSLRAGAVNVSSTQPHGWGVQPKSLESTPATKAELWEKYQQAKQATQERANNRHPAPAQSTTLPIQAKLTIGEPGDKYEQEADQVASQVVEQIHAPTAAQSTQGESVQRQDELEEEIQAKPSISHLQRSPLSPEVQREAMPEEEDIQAKSILQRAIAGGEASADLESAINIARGSGQPLDAGLQVQMGQAMGSDFSGVKVHTDAQADQLNQSIQAKAFTTGQDVFFRQGAYQPGSRGGQELIAHELTHVVQQNGGAVQRSSDPVKNEKPKIVDFKTKSMALGAANLIHEVQWKSSTGDLNDLKQITIREAVSWEAAPIRLGAMQEYEIPGRHYGLGGTSEAYRGKGDDSHALLPTGFKFNGFGEEDSTSEVWTMTQHYEFSDDSKQSWQIIPGSDYEITRWYEKKGNDLIAHTAKRGIVDGEVYRATQKVDLFFRS